MRILRSFLAFFAPDLCGGCGAEGSVICTSCSVGLYHPDQCIGCKKPSLGGMTCEKCARNSSVTTLLVGSTYGGLGKSLVQTMKYRPSLASANLIGEIVASKLPHLSREEIVVTHAPTTGSRVRERGFDQAKEIAKSVARVRKLPYITLLRRLSNSHQVGSGKKDRIEHMKDAFTAKNLRYISGKTIVLIDDVLTTGATIESAARVLKNAGASRIVALVFARAE